MKSLKTVGSFVLGCLLALPLTWANEEIDSSWYGSQPDVYALYSRDAAGNNSYAFTPSPEQWRDKNIYQLFTDRFATDGVDRLAGYKPAWTCDGKAYPYNRNFHHGGNWNGLRQQLDYLEGMGVTALWISGVQQNDQGKDPNYTPYHQYHAENYFKCDPAMGTFQDLKNLIDDCHARGMYVILDVAPNHTCDKNGINTGNDNDDKAYWPDGHGSFGWWNDGNKHNAPFDNLNYFHPNGTINCWDCWPEQINGQFKGTDDLNSEHPEVQDILLKAFKNLIDATDCDGFRVDAIKHVPYNWCRDWAQAVRDHAAYRGKSNFLMFGELFSYDNGALASWCADGYGFNSALQFPMMQAMKNVFGNGYSSHQLGQEMGNVNMYGAGKDNVIAFLDNHDVNRFACDYGGGDAATAKAIMSPAMTFLYMAPPVPLLFYGTEHMFNQGGHYNGSNRTWDNPDDGDWQRECMFDKGFQPGNASGDMFSQWAKDRGLYGHIAYLNDLRNKCRALRRGGFEQRRASDGQGIYAFTKWYGDEVALVILNTADYEMDLGDVYAGKGGAEFKENGVGPASFTSAGDGKIAFGATKIGGKGTKIFICNFTDNSADVFGGGGTPSGLWARGTYGYPTESATMADTIYINTEAGPLGSVAKVEIIYGVNDPGGDWPKVEMEINTNWASAQGAWYHYELPGAELEVGTLDYAICVTSTNGTEFWDNNGGGNYTMQILPAPEVADFAFQSVSANPVNPEPDGSVTVTVTLLTDAATVVDDLACTIGYDVYDPATNPAAVWPTYPMAFSNHYVYTNGTVTNRLSSFTYVVDSGLSNGYVMKYYVAASNGTAVLYANNNGDNYSVVVQDWPAVPADIVVTTPDATTQSAEATVAGTAGANLAGSLYWTNALTGETGSFPLSGYWSVPVPLNVGTNAITVYGYEAGNVATTAQDSASNYATFTDGDNQGTGFGDWEFNHIQGTGSAGVFIGDPAAAEITGFGAEAFGFYANPPGSGANAEVLRSFSNAMAVGSTFGFDWGVNWDSNYEGSYRGFSLLAGETELIYVNMSNSATIQINGSPMFTSMGAQAMPLSFEYVADGNIRVRGTGRDGAESYDQTLSVPAGAPSRMKFYFNASDSGTDERQMYVDNFTIAATTLGDKKQDSVTLTREDDGNPRIEYAGARSLTLGEAGAAFDLDFSLANATAASWSAALTTLNGAHVQSWSDVAGSTWNWDWTAYAAGTWRLRVTAHAAGGAAITNATVVLTASEGSSYVLGNAWHCPTNREPYEDKYMRHPVQPAVGETIEIFVGNYHPQGDMTGGTLVYRYGTNGAWSSSALAWATNTNDDNNRFFVGSQVVPAGQNGGTFQYYLKAEYTNDVSPIATFLAMDPEQSAMYKLFKREGAAQATPFEVGIKDTDGEEPGYIWHGGDITAGGPASVQIGAKIGYVKDGVKWADEAIVRYRVKLEDEGVRQVRGVTRIEKAPVVDGKRSWNALTNQVSMVYDGEIADSSPNGNAMRWVANLTDTNLMNERAVLVYEIYARGDNGVWRQAEYNAGGGASTFEFRLWSDGSGDLQVKGSTRDYDSGWLAADYTTTKYFIDEADPDDAVALQVRYNAPANAQKVELFTNVGRRDHADADMNGDGWPDGIVPPDGDSITAENTYDVDAGYWQAIPMALGAGGWEKTLTVDKCGAYRLSARFLAAGETNGNWTWYSEGPEGAVRRDHAVVISPRKALTQTMYELNVFTVKATNTAQEGRGTFEKLSEKLLGGGDFDEFSLEYLNKLNVNCLWFQPIHPSGGDRVEIDPATGQRYWPGSPYGTKNYFSVNPDMADDPSEVNAVAAFTNYVRLCDRARGETMAEGARELNTINVMLDGVMNHTSWDAVYGDGLALATNGLGAAAITELTNAYGDLSTLLPEGRIATTGEMGINWYSRATNYAMPATTYVSATNNDVAVAPERVDFGKWNDVAELLYGNYSTMIRFDDRTEAQKASGELTEETSRMYNEDDQYYYDQMLPATKLLWKYMASYPEFWLAKTGHGGANQPGATDGNGVLLDDYGIDGLRCDYAQGLPSQFWEYLINRTRSKKWNFLFMAESLDGGLVGKRSNRHFDILNENMVFRFTQEKVSEPAPLQAALEERRTLYGNGIILLNLSSHDEPLPFGDPWATASRYAMVSAVDGVPMILYGQEHAISPYAGTNDTINAWKGFYLFEQNFGKWIPHFKKWNQMYVWDDPCYTNGDFRDSRAMAQFYARVNQARLASPALRSKNRWFLNDNPRMMTVAKWETEGGNPNVSDSVIVSVLFMNETGDTAGLTGNAQTYDLSPLADKLGLEDRTDRFYNIRNLAAADTNALIWPEAKAGSEIITNFYVGIAGGVDTGVESPEMVWEDGAVVQYLQFVDVTAYPAPTFQVGAIPADKEVGDAVAISVTATGDGEPVVTLTNAPAGFVSTYENDTLAFTPNDDGTFAFYFLAQNQRNDAFATTNFSVTILPGSGGETQEVAIAEIANITTGGGQFGFRATFETLPPSITTLPVWTADTLLENGSWNWTFYTNVVVDAGMADIQVPVVDKCFISVGKPRGVD